MNTSVTPLPDTLEQCHALIHELMDKLAQSQLLNQKQRYQLEQLLRARYGQKADRIDPDQMLLFVLEQMSSCRPEEDDENDEQEDTDSPEKKRKRRGHGRKPLPDHLPRKRVEHEVSPEEKICGQCDSEKDRIGEDVSERLEYVPASLYVLQDVRPKYACRNCEAEVVRADKPMQPIEKGLPGPGLLAHVITSKYADHLPLNRLEGILGRHDVDIARSTMCGWMGASADLLEPLYALMHQEVLASKVIHTDDTTISVLDRRLTKTRTGRIWVYIGDDAHPYTLFDYTPTRSREGPLAFLDGYSGYLQADAYAGYDEIY